MDNVQNLLGVSMQKIKEMVDVNTVIGNPITLPDGITLIPVSRVSIGFASGGSDLPNKTNAELFGGGSGAGINIVPVAFLVVNNGSVRVLHMAQYPDTVDRLIDLVPATAETITGLFRKKDKTPVEPPITVED